MESGLCADQILQIKSDAKNLSSDYFLSAFIQKNKSALSKEIKTVRSRFILISSLLIILNGVAISFYQPAVWILLLMIPFILLGTYDIVQKKHTVWRNFRLKQKNKLLVQANEQI